MGELDLIKPYLELKGQVFFGRLNMKPGKPTTFGRIDDTLVLALPGNPVSCFVTASLFLKPIIAILENSKLERTEMISHHFIKAQFIPSRVKLDPIRPEYHRCTLYQESETGKFYAVSTGKQMSSRLLSAKNANGLSILPASSKDNNGEYRCKGETKIVVIGDIIRVSKS